VLVAPVLKDLDGVTKLTVSDLYTAHPLAENLKATRTVAGEIGRDVFIMGRADQGPFSLASMLLGVENFLVALAEPENGPKLHRLLEFCHEVVYRYAVAQHDQGAHITSIGESLAGPDVSSPRTYREYEWGYAKRLVERLGAHHIPLAYRICSNATRIVGDMVATGAAVLELDYKCDLAKIKQATQGRSAILGVIDPSEVLALGTPDLMVEKARQELEVLAPGGWLILGPGCALPPASPPANIHALMDSACRFCRYAPDGSLLK